MNWWHQWRHDVWQLEYLYCRGKLASMDSLGVADQFELHMIQARKMIAEGKTIYHRLKLGEAP